MCAFLCKCVCFCIGVCICVCIGIGTGRGICICRCRRRCTGGCITCRCFADVDADDMYAHMLLCLHTYIIYVSHVCIYVCVCIRAYANLGSHILGSAGKDQPLGVVSDVGLVSWRVPGKERPLNVFSYLV